MVIDYIITIPTAETYDSKTAIFILSPGKIPTGISWSKENIVGAASSSK